MSTSASAALNPKNILKDFSVQIRAAQGDPDSSYDISGLKSALLTTGFVRVPLAVEKMKNGKIRVLQGFTRLLAIDDIEKDKDIPEAVKEKFRMVNCIVYEDLTPQERNDIVYDDQTQKKLTKIEVIRWLWKLSETQEYSEIVWEHFRQLVHLAGSTKQDEFHKKMNTELKTESAKKAYVTGFFTGTINDEILKAKSLGPVVQKAFIETVAGRTEEDSCEFVCNRGALTELGKCRTRDLCTDPAKMVKYTDWNKDIDGKGWTMEDGGLRFNECLADLKAKKGKLDPNAQKVLTVKAIDERILQTKSRIGKIVYKIAKGGKDLQPDERNFGEIDMNIEALESIQGFIAGKLDEVKAKLPEPIQAVLMAIAYTSGSSAGFELALSAALNPPQTETETEPEPRKGKGKGKNGK
jgi:hypothetical protein